MTDVRRILFDALPINSGAEASSIVDRILADLDAAGLTISRKGEANSVDYHQRRGRDADIISETLAAYREYMLDDDYEVAPLHTIFQRMQERFQMVDRLPPKGEPDALRDQIADVVLNANGNDYNLAESKDEEPLCYEWALHIANSVLKIDGIARTALANTDGGWRDIEGAPKDGTRFLIGFPDIQHIELGKWSSKEQAWSNTYGIPFVGPMSSALWKPIHALPTPPTEAE